MHIGCVHTRTRFGVIWIDCTLNQFSFGSGLELNSLFIHRKSCTVTSRPPRIATLSKLSLFRPPYTPYSPSKIHTMMAHHARMLLTRRYQKQETAYHVVRRNSRSTSFTTSKKVINLKQVNEQTLVCVLIHLHVECWLDKTRVEIITWAAVGVACQLQFSYNSVLKYWQCECDQRGFNLHSMRIGCVRIQFAFK